MEAADGQATVSRVGDKRVNGGVAVAVLGALAAASGTTGAPLLLLAGLGLIATGLVVRRRHANASSTTGRRPGTDALTVGVIALPGGLALMPVLTLVGAAVGPVGSLLYTLALVAVIGVLVGAVALLVGAVARIRAT